MDGGEPQGPGTACPGACGGALGACCLMGACTEALADDCLNAGGVPESPGTTCADAPCAAACGSLDFDVDFDIDLDDYAAFFDCLAGPADPVGSGCCVADTNGDGTVDMVDLAALQVNFSP